MAILVYLVFINISSAQCDIILASVVATDETCLGNVDGTITITATSSNPIEYSIDGGSTFFPGMTVFTGLADGNYTIVVRDIIDPTCSASNILYTTDFENPPFALGNLVGQDGWINQSGSGSFLQVIPGQAVETVHGGGSREDARVDLGQTAVAGTIFKYEFDVTVNGTVDATTTYFTHFQDGGTGFNSRVFVTAPNVATNNFTFAIGETSSSTPAAIFATDFNYGQTYRLSGSYSFDTGISTLTVDGGAAINSTSQADPGEDLGFWALRQSGGNTSQVIDNLIVFTSMVIINPGTTKTWDGANWSPPGDPDMTNRVVINGPYLTGINGTINGNIDACSCELNALLVVEQGSYVKVEGDITNNLDILVINGGSIVQVDDAAIVANNGSIRVEKITPAMAAKSFMISGSPMTMETEKAFSAMVIL